MLPPANPGLSISFYLIIVLEKCEFFNPLTAKGRKETQFALVDKLRFFSGGRWWIRTTEAEKQQIYSLPPLATREISHIEEFTKA